MLTRLSSTAPVLMAALALSGLASTIVLAAARDGIDASILAPGLVQADAAIDRLERLVEEAEAIGTALFRVHNKFGEHRAAIAAAAAAAARSPDIEDVGTPADCTTPWLLDLGARSREFGRAFRDAVQSARVQGRRVENLTVEPTVQPLIDPETNHRLLSLLARVDALVRSYPEAASWQERYVEPKLQGCEPALVPAPGIDNAPPEAIADVRAPSRPRKARLIAVLAFGGGWLCPGSVPAAGVMLVSGEICYSASEICDCETAAVSPATVLGPEAKAGSAN